jgi:hypothetical protein
MSTPSFPPLLAGHAVQAGEDPFEVAIEQATKGCDAGLIVHDLGATQLRAAFVFAPEVPLSKAAAMMPVCSIGFQNALGALAPPEVGLHFDWAGGLRVNGGLCGRMRMAASTTDPQDVPDWLVVGFELSLWPGSEESGLTPDQTALYSEGCAEVDALNLLEAWARHSLVWINRWEDEGTAAIHREWTGLAHGVGTQIVQNGVSGSFTGIDEDFGLLLKTDTRTRLFPLTTLLEARP